MLLARLQRPLRPMLLLVALLLAPGPAGAQPPTGLPLGDAHALGFRPERLLAIDAMLDDAVKAGRIAGGSALVARYGQIAYLHTAGQRDREASLPFTPETIVRIASMTKPITSVAILILADDGKLKLDDPVAKHLPEFARMQVLVPRAPGADGPAYTTIPAARPITIHHLLTHTAGLGYGLANSAPLSPLYRDAAVSDGLVQTPGTLAANIQRLARVPLQFHPGESWQYSLATDVLGRVVEAASGQTFGAFCRERIFAPLKMVDTHFLVPEAKRDRLAAVYGVGGDGLAHRTGDQPVQRGALVYSTSYPAWDDGQYESGGAGLCSTLGDYARFLQMLLNNGALDGARVLKPETVEMMTRNQIGDLPMPDWGHGDRFGYGVAVVTQPVAGGASEGSFSWGGFFTTYFWADRKRDVIGILFTQTYPAGTLKLRVDLQRLTYEALKDDTR